MRNNDNKQKNVVTDCASKLNG